MSLKTEMICNICKLILKDPVSLPCSSAICSGHLSEPSIRCLECEKEFEVPQNGFPPNKMASNILAKELCLSDEEKTIKTSIQKLIQQLEHLPEELKREKSDLERISFDHFSELRRQIDVQREELKNKIDEIALKMIDRVNQKEKAYNKKIEESFLNSPRIDIEQSKHILANEFRKPNLLVEKVKQMQNEQQQKVNEFQRRIKEISSLCGEIESLVFESSQSFQDESFGLLKSKLLIACALDNKIQIWNLASNECVATLEGHSRTISCLEQIDKNRFASGSDDDTIRIWDAKNFVCLKTLITSNRNKGLCLKSLTSNRLASSSKGDIKILNIESGECLQTLDDPTSGFGYLNPNWNCRLVYLPNGNLISCTQDKTIKVWDLTGGECMKKLKGHSDWVLCLLLLINGQLASGSEDNTIKIWDMESGECVKTLQGHSNGVWRLQQLESGKLVSCSRDNTINIWDLTKGSFSKFLVDRSEAIKSIRVNNKNNTLVSCSDKKTIKTWDLKTGACINTITVQNYDYGQLMDLIFI